ncbi:cytochrome c biogenesis protein CcsA [Marinospirillum sp. MEB164]|uniref:Cytochrome c biogenesis protein CcsA n=1 Tax=Marinospirillum alkalitolerans TaxID=3123374 RepID=A0ABW8PT20_9GAMM
MVASLPLSLLAIAFYLAGASWLWLRLLGKVPEKKQLVQVLGSFAFIHHSLVLFDALGLPSQLHLGLAEVALLLTWLTCSFILFASLRHPTLNLGALLFPLAALALAFAQFTDRPTNLLTKDHQLYFHILASLSAYGLFALASVQSVLLGMQNYQLKHRHLQGLISVLPPLQIMERLLFDLLLAGQLLLTLGMLSGWLYFDHFFAPGLLHKTLLSFMAWIIFGILLFGHWRFGWRGLTAVRWTLGGSLLLLLAYFGSQFVLQFLLA